MIKTNLIVPVICNTCLLNRTTHKCNHCNKRLCYMCYHDEIICESCNIKTCKYNSTKCEHGNYICKKCSNKTLYHQCACCIQNVSCVYPRNECVTCSEKINYECCNCKHLNLTSDYFNDVINPNLCTICKNSVCDKCKIIFCDHNKVICGICNDINNIPEIVNLKKRNRNKCNNCGIITKCLALYESSSDEICESCNNYFSLLLCCQCCDNNRNLPECSDCKDKICGICKERYLNKCKTCYRRPIINEGIKIDPFICQICQEEKNEAFEFKNCNHDPILCLQCAKALHNVKCPWNCEDTLIIKSPSTSSE